SETLAPVRALAVEAKLIRIKGIETFSLELPATPVEVEAGVMNRIAVTRVVTESGMNGYSFGGPGGGGGGRGGAGARGGAAGSAPGGAQPAAGRGGRGPGLTADPAAFRGIRDAL